MGLDPVTMMVGGQIIGGIMGADAAGSAADAQVQAAQQSAQAQRDIFNKTVELQDPFRQLGVGSGQKLSYLLGITPQTGITPGVPVGSPTQTSALTPSTGALSTSVATNGGQAPAQGGPSADQIRQWHDAGVLAPQGVGQPFRGPGGVMVPADMVAQAVGGFSNSPSVPVASFAPQQTAPAAQPAQVALPPTAENSFNGTGGTAGSSDGFGSLLHNFGAQDFQLDPGIQFQIQQGQQALQNSQAAKDGILGGAALKGLMDFNQRMAGTGYQSAFDRYMANRQFTLGSLMDMTKLGQAAASGTTSGAPSFASSIGNSIQGAGNASAAGTIGSANALSGGLNGVGNAFMLRNILNGGGGSGVPPNPFAGGPISGDALSYVA